MFFSSKLKKYKNIKHCFFSRKNGVSEGNYYSLNCGLGSNDKKENILKNLEIVTDYMGCKKETLITLNQKHTNQVIYFNNKKSLKNKLNGDAIVSDLKNIGISILSADCVPILFYDPIKKIIGCAHAGWKGALDGIIKNTVKKFNELNSKSTDIIAVVGPCIGEKSYEVNLDFYEKFISVRGSNKKFFDTIKKEKYTFDLRAFVNAEISNQNIKSIENIEKDTFSERELFYSYRRSCLKKESDYGRCISVILMT